MTSDESLEVRAREALAARDRAAVFEVADALRPRLERAVALRMDPRLRGRVSASDVLQDTFVELDARLPGYLDEPTEDTGGARARMPFFLWLRFLTLQKLQQAYRAHIAAGARDARRERELEAPGSGADASAFILASALAASGATPSRVAAHEEQRALVARALEQLDPVDREVLVLRHFEQLRNKDVAAVLELTETGASLRYVSALQKLRHVLQSIGVTLSAGALSSAGH